MMRLAILALALVASPAIAAHCPHGQMLRVSMGRCVALGSPLALAYQSPTHWMRQPIAVALPADLEPLALPVTVTAPSLDDDVLIDIPLTDPDPATTALKLQLEHKALSQ